MKLLILLFIFISSCLPAGTFSEIRPFIAVFSNPEESFKEEWEEPGSFPDYIFFAKDWQDFPTFLVETIKRSEGRPLVIDIDTHGTKSGFFALQYSTYLISPVFLETVHEYHCTAGFILNNIEIYIPPGRLKELEIESCYGGYLFSKGRLKFKEDSNGIEDIHCAFPTPYPIYTVENHLNLGNSVFLQRYKYKENICLIEVNQLREPIDHINRNPFFWKCVKLAFWLDSHN